MCTRTETEMKILFLNKEKKKREGNANKSKEGKEPKRKIIRKCHIYLGRPWTEAKTTKKRSARSCKHTRKAGFCLILYALLVHCHSLCFVPNSHGIFTSFMDFARTSLLTTLLVFQNTIKEGDSELNPIFRFNSQIVVSNFIAHFDRNFFCVFGKMFFGGVGIDDFREFLFTLQSWSGACMSTD